ncbi:hypothetical protein L6164_031541 [Bauhinia variegata]|uniref:Uncharacterized protein n=1 Tax=Bauhinia variegata TaxID=167791 RepID=A0ACB9LFB4_BAUVA|nr:hypothetical protein L6164_031541 [Bauhinia variegata]
MSKTLSCSTGGCFPRYCGFNISPFSSCRSAIKCEINITKLQTITWHTTAAEKNNSFSSSRSAPGVPSQLLILTPLAQTVFDITKFGGKANADITQALRDAFKEACASPTPSKVVIPAGTYNLNAIDLKGKGTFDGQGATAWKQNDCGKNTKCKMASMNFGFNFLTNALISQITSKDSKNFNVNVLGCNNITFDHFTISAPAESLNTDGIHVGRSTIVNILNSNIATGDDCVSLGDGSKQVLQQ